MAKSKTRIARQRRHIRVREKVEGANDRPRLSVFRSLNHIYVQVIDDTRGHTLTSASTLAPEIKKEANGKNKLAEAELVGTVIAKQALSQGIKEVVFDRGGYKYHGRIKALAEAARREGLVF
jgi:large subunit ribosomal protein L18